MFKYLLLATLFITFSNADTMYNGKCVKEFYTLDKSKIYISYSDGSINSVNYNIDVINSLITNDVFTYDKSTKKCYIETFYGLTKNQFNFMAALTGLLTSILLVSSIQKRL
ncbi:hypothetical protein [Aliarcobacter cryaerophilus]|uniref:hypothetical protein n=1 Tax=Aliarcobacter cryaerophilus TaxID=28198 RepID=UPI0021B166D0|nr:hypothetical protein [Aliarcobacter cryaerophilus]MCT7513883.1 hypothetical protein [Aliarcobacter cryaerophilus]MCT7518276.1 hypothetical protein [Aliarcobacter cryaerophilus]